MKVSKSTIETKNGKINRLQKPFKLTNLKTIHQPKKLRTRRENLILIEITEFCCFSFNAHIHNWGGVLLNISR